MPNGNGSITGGHDTVSSTKSWKTSYMMGVIIGTFAATSIALASAIGMVMSAG